ncbi:galactosylceramide sulfotransferase-like [Saccoglossus kowalevskii]
MSDWRYFIIRNMYLHSQVSVMMKKVVIISLVLVCCLMCLYYYELTHVDMEPVNKEPGRLMTYKQNRSGVELGFTYTVEESIPTHRGSDYNSLHVSSTKPEGCTPYNYFIFRKTAKTGSSTVAALLYRYGFYHDLVAALPDPPSKMMLHVTNVTVLTTKYDCNHTFPGYNYIASHILDYNYNVLKDFIPKAKFITILRSPIDTFESKFYFTNNHIKYGLQNQINPLEIFLFNSAYQKYINTVLVSRVSTWFDLTSGHELLEMEKQFDLVMITEYMDESLVLLKKMMCWTFDDVIYHSNKVSDIQRQPMTAEMKQKIGTTLALDIELYEYFNSTLWSKIQNYDGDFDRDLSLFRQKLYESTDGCRGKLKYEEEYCDLLTLDVCDLRRVNAKKQYEKFCRKKFKSVNFSQQKKY